MAATREVKLIGRPPTGVSLSDIWKDGGVLVRHDGQAPVDENDELVGEIAACPALGCDTAQWVFDPDVRLHCIHDGQPLIRSKPDGSLGDAETMAAEASRGIHALAVKILADRRDRASRYAQEQAERLQAAVAEAARRRTTDVRRHVPTVAAAAGMVAAGQVLADLHPLTTALAGVTLAASTPAVMAGAHYVANRHTRRTLRQIADLGPIVIDADDLSPDLRAKRHAKWFSRQERMVQGSVARVTSIASGVPMAAGMFLMGTAALEWIPLSLRVAMCTPFGAALSWAVLRRHWEDLWQRRRDDLAAEQARAVERARLAAEEAERLRLEALAAERGTEAPVDSEAMAAGKAFAARWVEISAMANVPYGLAITRTWVVPEETVPATMPGPDGKARQIGWDYLITCEPGALVAQGNTTPPIVSAQKWLKAVLFPDDASVVSVVDAPEGAQNRARILVTTGMPLAEAVPYRGRDGIRRHKEGRISAFVGRDLAGNDVYKDIFIPGQFCGGLVSGAPGGGKTGFLLGLLLDWLYAGIFPLLMDPKDLADLADFLGVFPIACTPEHRMVFLEFLHKEVVRRNRKRATVKKRDRLGRLRQGMAGAVTAASDDPILGIAIDEYSACSGNEAFWKFDLATARISRTANVTGYRLSQAGGLNDWGSSEGRMFFRAPSLTITRMSKAHASLAGYGGDTDPESLPRLPGMSLLMAAGAPEIPMRLCYVSRLDEEGSVYDRLYDANNTLILPPPTLPEPTIELMKSTGVWEIWQAAKGPDGAARLVEGFPTCEPTETVTEDGVITTIKVPVVSPLERLLLLAWNKPGSTGTEMTNDPLLPKLMGRVSEDKPTLSTVTRPIPQAQKGGLITCKSTGGGVHITITDKGRELVAHHAARLGLLTDAYLERQNEMKEGEDEDV